MCRQKMSHLRKVIEEYLINRILSGSAEKNTIILYQKLAIEHSHIFLRAVDIRKKWNVTQDEFRCLVENQVIKECPVNTKTSVSICY